VDLFTNDVGVIVITNDKGELQVCTQEQRLQGVTEVESLYSLSGCGPGSGEEHLHGPGHTAPQCQVSHLKLQLAEPVR
jgi:hypothetical protein